MEVVPPQLEGGVNLSGSPPYLVRRWPCGGFAHSEIFEDTPAGVAPSRNQRLSRPCTLSGGSAGASWLKWSGVILDLEEGGRCRLSLVRLMSRTKSIK